MNIYIPLGLALVIGFAGLAQAAERPGAGQERRAVWVPQGVKCLRDLEFGKAGEKALLLDLYLPEQGLNARTGASALQGRLPLIIWIYGGAWRAGSKNGPNPALPFTTNGFAVAAIMYRLSQEAKWPAQIHDCKAAVRWLRANAGKYNLDAQRFVAWGSSAGAHLAALLGTSGNVKELEGAVNALQESSRVQGVVDWFGPTDFLQMNKAGSNMDHDAANSPEALLVGGPIQENKALAAKANPITYITKSCPPFLIMHGDQDRLVPFKQSELLVAALKKAGVKVTFVPMAGAGHGFRGGPETLKPVREFLEKYLLPQKNTKDSKGLKTLVEV